MKMNITNYLYKDSNISFACGENLMINATQMAKPFGKRPNDYLDLPSSLELIKAITRKSGIAMNQLVRTVRGGSNPGTWLHEDVALDFAQWLSVDFKLWCNDIIKELLLTGVATISSEDQIIACKIPILQTRLDQNSILFFVLSNNYGKFVLSNNRGNIHKPLSSHCAHICCEHFLCSLLKYWRLPFLVNFCSLEWDHDCLTTGNVWPSFIYHTLMSNNRAL